MHLGSAESGLKTWAKKPDCFVLAHCADFQMTTTEVYDRKTLLTRSWLYEVVTASKTSMHRIVGTAKHPDLVGHVFGLEETPGFHAEHDSEEKRRFIALSDMRRRDWPNVFVWGSGEQKCKNRMMGGARESIAQSRAVML
jgi:hypothetical protein